MKADRRGKSPKSANIRVSSFCSCSSSSSSYRYPVPISLFALLLVVVGLFSIASAAAIDDQIATVIKDIVHSCKGVNLHSRPLEAALKYYTKNRDRLSDPSNLGAALEFGVYKGSTVTQIAKTFSDRPVVGFDSFQGLPETWRPGVYEKGSFKLETLPILPANVHLMVGYFDETVPIYKRYLLHTKKIDFMHVDCDLYSSTKTILYELNEAIVPGTIIVFDEMVNYEGYEKHEIRALAEWMVDKGRKLAMLGLWGNSADDYLLLEKEEGQIQSVAMVVVK